MRLAYAIAVSFGLLAAPIFAQSTLPSAPAVQMVTVPVLDHAVAKGDLLGATDFVPKEMTPAEARGAPALRDIVGMEAQRALSAGTVVRTSDVIRPQLVRRGEPVTITLRDGGLTISTEGRALGNGAAGDFVRVVSLSTNRTLDGVVEGTGAIRVVAH